MSAPDSTSPTPTERKPPHVRVMGGPFGKPHRVPNPKTKRGWSLVQPRWRMHGYTNATLPAVLWSGATRYNLEWHGMKPYYVYDPQPKIRERVFDYRARPGQRSLSLGR